MCYIIVQSTEDLVRVLIDIQIGKNNNTTDFVLCIYKMRWKKSLQFIAMINK